MMTIEHHRRLRRRTVAARLLAGSAVAALVLAACGGDGDGNGDGNGGDGGDGSGGGDLNWATSDVDSAGHTALVTLANLLEQEWEGFSINVQPTGGAVQSVIGYATGQFDGYYGADIAFFEMARDSDRFEGFSERAERMPVQSFWAYPLETGLAIHARDADTITSWADLAGEQVFTGPAPWDVRANLERTMAELDVGHVYNEVDTGVVGSALDTGELAATIAYTTAETNPPPWLAEAVLQTDLTVLDPSEAEVAQLEEAGFEVVEVSTAGFNGDVGAESVLLVPFFYGFHLGMDVSEDDIYEMLNVIEAGVDQLAEDNPSYSVLADDMAEFQRRGVEASIDDIEVHPGLARWMRERDVWDDAWDDRVAAS